jgi:hypothetical protein
MWGQVLTQTEIDAKGVECAPDLLQRRLLAQPNARPQRDHVAERVIDRTSRRVLRGQDRLSVRPGLAPVSKLANGSSQQRGSQFRRVGHENHLLAYQFYQVPLSVSGMEHRKESDILSRTARQVFTAMLDGWRAQQLAQNLAFSTVARREAIVQAFAAHADALPWRWEPQMIDEWLGDMRGVRGRSRSTVRSYASSVSAFCRYVTDPAYGWADECQARFGTHPVQVVHEWNAAVPRPGERRWAGGEIPPGHPTFRGVPGRRSRKD